LHRSLRTRSVKRPWWQIGETEKTAISKDSKVTTAKHLHRHRIGGSMRTRQRHDYQIADPDGMLIDVAQEL